MSFYVSEQGKATYNSWERAFQVKQGPDFILECKVFFNEECHSVPQLRIDSMLIHGFSFDVGGGSESHIDFEIGAPNGHIDSSMVSGAVSRLLTRLQGQSILMEYPDTGIDIDSLYGDELEDYFRW